MLYSFYCPFQQKNGYVSGKASGMETSERLNQKAKQKKHKDQKGRVDFIQKNIEVC